MLCVRVRNLIPQSCEATLRFTTVEATLRLTTVEATLMFTTVETKATL